MMGAAPRPDDARRRHDPAARTPPAARPRDLGHLGPLDAAATDGAAGSSAAGSPPQGPAGSRDPQGATTGDRLRQTWNGEASLGLPPTPVLVRVGQIAAPLLVLVAVLIPFDDVPLLDNVLWSLWALAAAALQALPALGLGGSDERRWTIAAVGTGGLALYWLLVSLPTVATSSGFLVTAATAAAVAGVLTMPGRRL